MGDSNARDQRDLLRLLHISTPGAVWAEVISLWETRLIPEDRRVLTAAVRYVESLFAGQIAGIRSSNAEYHDLEHTAVVTLAMARLLDGAARSDVKLSSQETLIGLVSALFHDTGYLQDASETVGTGARHTLGHEARSADRLKEFADEHGLGKKFRAGCLRLIDHTSVHGPQRAGTESTGARLSPTFLMFSDLFGQMADRTYVEKLLLLYREFEEAGVGHYRDEYDLLMKTPSFYSTTIQKNQTRNEVSAFFRQHFEARAGVGIDLYDLYVRKNLSYLSEHVSLRQDDYRSLLRRDGIVAKLGAA